jgi:hypothetical protein
VNLTIRIVFKTEGILAGIPFNSSVRIRVFDEGDDLVAATTVFSDAGALSATSNAGFFADGRKLESQPIPAGTTTLEYVALAGLFGYVEPSTGSASVRSATLFSPDYGVWGVSTHPGSYGGEWTVMVDVVNWYLPHSFYPAAPALLQGESPFFNPYNHLGPYQQLGYAKISNVAQGGEASAEFEMDLRSYVQGIVLGLDWNDATRTMSWAHIEIKSGAATYNWYTWDGWFDGYLDPGTYRAALTEWTALSEGHNIHEFTLNATEGQSSTATILLGESGIAIPEFSDAFVVITVMISLSFIALGSRQRCRKSNRSS